MRTSQPLRGIPPCVRPVTRGEDPNKKLPNTTLKRCGRDLQPYGRGRQTGRTNYKIIEGNRRMDKGNSK